jgi:hypothetical protein
MTDDRIDALVSDALERVRGQLQHELGALAESLSAHTAAARDEAARTARTAAETAAATLASEAIAAERAAFAEKLNAACDEAREQALTAAQADERAADLARAERLLGAVRSLDAATSLSETLDALTSAAAAEAGRAAVLVVRGDDFRGWSQSGFADLADPRALVLPHADAGLLGGAVASAAMVSSAAADGSHAALPPAPFAVPEGALGVAAPLVVDGRVVAVVYADDGGGGEHEVPSAWPEHVELLARHASRCLEALTARQAIRPRPRLAAVSSPGDAESARRYARLLVSEIKLYHEAQVDEGRRAGDLRSRLADQIARARELYEQRVPSAVPSRADLFEQELVRTLADGDAALLGRAS